MVEGIAVGMATKMAPHNLTEIYNALIYIIDNVKEGLEPNETELLKIIKGPDFPLGGQIVGTQGIYDAFTTGRGKIVMRSKYEIIESKKSIEVIVTEIPYKVNKASLVEKIYQLSKKAITEIKSVEDQSNKDGIRIVIELKKDCNVDLVVNRLLKSGCGLQKTYSINNTVIMDGVPKVVSTIELLEIFFKHSIEVVMKKTEYNYNKNASRYAIVNAILWVLTEKLDEVVHVIRTSKTQEEAINSIKELYYETAVDGDELSDEQAKAIAEMKLRHLSEDNIERYTTEATALSNLLDYLSAILTDQNVLFDVIRNKYVKMRDEHGDARRTEIIQVSSDIREEDLVADETLVLTYTTDGIIKTVSEKEYEVTNRGTKGTKSGSIKEDEAILYMQTVHSKDYIVFFTSLGKCFALRAFQIQKTSRTSRGKSIYNYLPLQEGEKIVSLVNIASDADGAFTLITKSGAGKRLSVKDLPQTSSGARAITFRDGDELIAAIFGQEEDNIMVTTREGMSISFKAEDIRVMGRTAAGVKAIDLREGDLVVAATVLKPEETVLTVTELGLGKRTDTSEFTIQSRGGKGVRVHKLNEKTGQLVCAMSVKDDDELFVATSYGLIVRTRVQDISTLGRNTSGVKIVKLNDGDSIVSISVVQKEEEEVEDGVQQ